MRASKNAPKKFNRRTHMLIEFLPAVDGRKPHGFSGSGAWYQTPTKEPPIIWVPEPVLAGIITNYFPDSKVLEICRVERLVAFLNLIERVRDRK